MTTYGDDNDNDDSNEDGNDTHPRKSRHPRFGRRCSSPPSVFQSGRPDFEMNSFRGAFIFKIGCFFSKKFQVALMMVLMMVT